MAIDMKLNRRTLLASGVAAMMLPGVALAAISASQAEVLIGKVVADINAIINSGQSEAKMINRFEGVFLRYADTKRIALTVLGADGRRASASQKQAFVKAFTGYIANRYGSRFREFEGGKIEVVSSKVVKSKYIEVLTNTKLKGQSPFDVIFVVSAADGKFIDMVVEGISIVKSERKEIGAMLDRRKGNLDLLIQDLAKY